MPSGFRLMGIGVRAWGMKACLCGCLLLKSVSPELWVSEQRFLCSAHSTTLERGGKRNIQDLITLSKDKGGTSLSLAPV